jgi:molybdopterin synthase catalytic subunit
MKVQIVLFATLKDRAGLSRTTLDVEGAPVTLADVRRALTASFPALESALPSAVASLNQEFAFGPEIVREGDEIGFFPPVSGGAGWPEHFQVAAEAIDLNVLTAAITTPETGAICLFSGAVRGQTTAEGHLPQTLALEYEAYEPMALQKMAQVAAEIRERWPLVQGIAIVQRVGLLHVGEPTVLIACASGHRDQGCFEAARYGIDRLKEIVPVWKKEIGASGEQWIAGNYHPDSDDRAV